MKPATLRIGIVGHGFIARVHTNAWSVVARAFPLRLRPELVALAGRDRVAATAAAVRLGWANVESSWEELVARSDLDVVDICAPDYLHATIGVAALKSGKHVLCEKPLASCVSEATDMVSAAERASRRGVRAMVGFNYRRVPALELTRRLISEDRLGQLTHLRCSYLQDWLEDPESETTWKSDSERSPLGALSDLGSHVVDLAQHVAGHNIQRLVGAPSFGDRSPFTSPNRDRSMPHVPTPELTPTREPSRAARGASAFLAELTDGVVASFEVSRVAAGHLNDLRLEIGGTEGSIRFSLERLNELELFDRTMPIGERGFRSIPMTDPRHPWLGGWWPPGHILGWEHAFTHEVAAFVEAITEDRDPRPSFADGLQVQRVIAAVAELPGRGAGRRS